MQQFQPPGFGRRTCESSLGGMAYYLPVDSPWLSLGENRDTLPPLVFLHSLGGGSSAYEWSKVYPAFVANYRVMAPDLIGWGQSVHPVKDYAVEDYLTSLTDFLERQVKQPAVAAVSSLTAAIIVRLAIRRPDLFRGLVLVSPSGYGDFGVDYKRGMAAQLAGAPGIDKLVYALGAANELVVRNFLQQFIFAQPSRITEEMVAAYLASAQQPNAEYSALASLKGDLCFDLAQYMGELTTPTVMVWGARSRFNSPAVGRRLAQLNPDVIKEFYEIPDAGVLPHLELPAIVTNLLQVTLNNWGIG